MIRKIPVAVLGATGTVGQKFIRLLADHPWFEVTAVAASTASAGRRYEDAVRWREPVAIPPSVAGLVIQKCAPPLPGQIVFSALDAEIAGPIEQEFARTNTVSCNCLFDHFRRETLLNKIPTVPRHLAKADCI